MQDKKEQEIMHWQELPELTRMKYEAAKELGLLDVVREKGWKSLSSRDTGRIGGIVARKRKK